MPHILSPPITALALQGGGTHGAFTWGALDRLTEEGLAAQRVGGVSSGALLAVAYAQGLARGGPAAARADMAALWSRIARAHERSGMPWFWGGEIARQNAGAMLRLFGPAPGAGSALQASLRSLIEATLDPALLCGPKAPRVTVSATDAQTGQAVLFANASITPDVLLASCCLPLLFPAVRIGGRVLWDGAYSGNPPLHPLLGPRPPAELILIRGQSRQHQGVPTNPQEVGVRATAIAFNAVLAAELAALPATVRLRDIGDDATLASLTALAEMAATGAQIETLYSAGRRAAALPAQRREAG